jgi:hypothetical protein
MGIRTRYIATALALALAGGCSTPPDAPAARPDDIAASPWARAGSTRAAWVHYPLPGKAAARYRYARNDGRHTVAAEASSAASMLRLPVRVEPQELGAVRFSWKVPQLLARADLGRRDAADSPVRLILAFEGDRASWSARDSLLSELTRAVTGEEMPYATLMYVWCNERPAGTVIRNARTDRIRKIVLESGPGKLNRWLDYERDIRADYERAFGEKPGALVGVAIMTDSDNTRSDARAWYGPVSLLPRHAGR